MCVADTDSDPIIGKWLVFKHFNEIDETWEKIRMAMAYDNLKGCVRAKSSTIRYNPSSGGPGPNTTAVICVCTKEHNMDDIGFKLIEIVKQDIRFKMNALTFSGIYSHNVSFKTSAKTIYWNGGKPSFVCEGKRYSGTSYTKKDIWQINVVEAPEPLSSEEIHGRWVIEFESGELTRYWHEFKELIESKTEHLGVIKMVCPPKRVRNSPTGKPAFHLYTSEDRKTSAGKRIIGVVQRNIAYKPERKPGSQETLRESWETLYWNGGNPDHVSREIATKESKDPLYEF